VDLDDWEPPGEVEAAWMAWTLLESTGWRFPLTVLLEQPDALMGDVATIAWLSSMVEVHMKGQGNGGTR